MSLNTTHAFNGAGVVLYNGERILLYTTDVGMGFSDNSLHAFKGEKKGKIYLTTHRIIFVNKNQGDELKSFSIPFACMREVELEQPVFGANHIKGRVLAEINGRWEGQVKFKLWFYSGGAIEFGQAMVKTGQMALKNRGHAPPPPAYQPAGNVFQAPPPAYGLFAEDNQYQWLPYGVFPNAPPASDVYMTDAPPPYPGMMSAAPMYPPPQPNGGYNPQGAPAYYNPNQPHQAYTQPSAPPAYAEVDTKSKKYD